MAFVELMEHPERALSTALKRSASQLNGDSLSPLCSKCIV